MTIQSGVLVRQGDTLVYVSLSGPSDGSIPDMGSTDSGVITAPSICQQAQAVARAVLGQ
jgi:ribonuclease PH